jgi:hypothetical protein
LPRIAGRPRWRVDYLSGGQSGFRPLSGRMLCFRLGEARLLVSAPSKKVLCQARDRQAG